MGKSAKRIYIVSNQKSGDVLVRASSQAQAIRHVVGKAYSAEVAGQDELVELMGLGVKVQDAGEADDVS